MNIVDKVTDSREFKNLYGLVLILGVTYIGVMGLSAYSTWRRDYTQTKLNRLNILKLQKELGVPKEEKEV